MQTSLVPSFCRASRSLSRSSRWVQTSASAVHAAVETKVKKPRQRKRATPLRKELERLRSEELGMPRASKSRLVAVDEDILASEQAELESIQESLHQMEFDHLPNRKDWKAELTLSKGFQATHRFFTSNRATIRDMVTALGVDAPERNGEKVTIIEGYAGPGTITSELLALPSVERVMALEDHKDYLWHLNKLKTQLDTKGESDRLDILTSSAYHFETYNLLFKEGRLAHLNNRVANSDGTFVDFCDDTFTPRGHSDASWQKLSPVMFVAQLPNTVYGEQLFAQIVTAIASRSWLFRHGRIKMAFICGESIANRCMAEPYDRHHRGKLGTTVQCLADLELHKVPGDLAPHGHHFFPATMAVGPRMPLVNPGMIPNSKYSRSARNGMVMITVTPKKDPLIKGRAELEAFEFITRNLFVLRACPVGEALTRVAPGGENVLKKTSQQQVDEGLITKEQMVLPHEKVYHLTNTQWSCLSRTFEKWPFRPSNLFDDAIQQRSN